MDKIDIKTVVGASELASVLGLSVRRIQQMIQDGTVTTIEKGKMNLCEAVQQYIAFVTRKQASDEQLDVEAKRQKAEADLKEAKAKIAQIEAKELEGSMHRAEDVEAITENLIYAMRGALIALPGRVAVDAFNSQSAAEASEVIRKEVHKVMRELTEYSYDPKKYEERVRDRKDWQKEGAELESS